MWKKEPDFQTNWLYRDTLIAKAAFLRRQGDVQELWINGDISHAVEHTPGSQAAFQEELFHNLQDERGVTQSSAARCIDISNSGVGIRCRHEIRVGSVVYIQAEDSHPAGYAVVRHCTLLDDSFVLGLELNEETQQTVSPPPDYYEFLQISPNAEPETIHRVYRFLAGRYHPDNPDTGDPE